MLKRFLYLVLFCGSSIFFGQQNCPFIIGTSFVKKNEVLLRWAPSNYALFQAATKFGYKIERIETLSEKLDTTVFKNISSQLIIPEVKPVVKDHTTWAELFDLGMNTEVVHSIIYEPIPMNPDPKKDVENKNLALGYALIICDLYADVAKATGLFFTDKTIDGTKKYIYKITINSTTAIKYKPAYVFADAGTLSVNPSNTTLHGKAGIKHIKLLWNTHNYEKNYTAYIIERSEDSINFKRINKNPFLPVTTSIEATEQEAEFFDSIQQNKKYYYQVKGINSFGELGPPSTIVCVKSKKYFTFPEIDSTKQIGGKQAVVYWKMPADIEPSYIKGFLVLRAKKAETHYESLTPQPLLPTTMLFTDTNPTVSNYYKIGAISIDNDTLFSFDALVKLTDITPPISPVGLQAVTDSSGVVKLSWSKNSDTDLRGYRVFRTNVLHEEFYEITKKFLTDTSFVDTIDVNTLTPQVYYALSAVDSNYNNSPLSVPYRLRRPDKIKPVKCIITELKQNDTAVVIHWIRSTSMDVINYYLFRSNNNSLSEKIKVFGVDDTTTLFADTNLNYGTRYFYSLVVVDSSNNSSVSTARSILFEPPVRQKIKTTSFNVDRINRVISLAWQYNYPDLENFVIYKAQKGHPLRIYKTLPANERTFKDVTLHPSSTYIYAIKAVFSNGTESAISDMLEINY